MEKICLVFPGQSSQYIGMGEKLYKNEEVVRKLFEEASKIIGMDLAELCFTKTSNNKLINTEYAQVAILTLSISMYECLMKNSNFKIFYLAGHSLGEITALTVAGAFRFGDAVKLVYERGKAMAKCCAKTKGGMVAVNNLDVETVTDILNKGNASELGIEIANYNTSTQTILSGNLNEIKKFEERLESAGAKIAYLNVSGAFHSHFMAEAADEFREVIKNINIYDINIPVMCNLEGRLYKDSDDIKELLIRQITEPVYWTNTMSKLDDMKTKIWLEVGPKNVLKNCITRTIKDAKVYAYDDEAEEFEELIKNYKLNQPNFLGLCLGAAVCTRNKNFNEEEYLEGVVKPYKEIEKDYQVIKSENRQPNEEEMYKALKLLKKIFETKYVDIDEQKERFLRISELTDSEQIISNYLK